MKMNSKMKALAILGMGTLAAATPLHAYHERLKNRSENKQNLAIKKLTGLNKKFRELKPHERKNFLDDAFNSSAHVTLITSESELRRDSTLASLLTNHFNGLPSQKISELLTGTAISHDNKRWILLSNKGNRPALLHEIGHIKAWDKGQKPGKAPLREGVYYPSFKARTLREEENANKAVDRQLSNLDKKYLTHAIDTYKASFLTQKSNHAKTVANIVSGLGAAALGGVVAASWRKKEAGLFETAQRGWDALKGGVKGIDNTVQRGADALGQGIAGLGNQYQKHIAPGVNALNQKGLRPLLQPVTTALMGGEIGKNYGAPSTGRPHNWYDGVIPRFFGLRSHPSDFATAGARARNVGRAVTRRFILPSALAAGVAGAERGIQNTAESVYDTAKNYANYGVESGKDDARILGGLIKNPGDWAGYNTPEGSAALKQQLTNQGLSDFTTGQIFDDSGMTLKENIHSKYNKLKKATGIASRVGRGIYDVGSSLRRGAHDVAGRFDNVNKKYFGNKLIPGALAASLFTPGVFLGGKALFNRQRLAKPNDSAVDMLKDDIEKPIIDKAKEVGKAGLGKVTDLGKVDLDKARSVYDKYRGAKNLFEGGASPIRKAVTTGLLGRDVGKVLNAKDGKERIKALLSGASKGVSHFATDDSQNPFSRGGAYTKFSPAYRKMRNNLVRYGAISPATRKKMDDMVDKYHTHPGWKGYDKYEANRAKIQNIAKKIQKFTPKGIAAKGAKTVKDKVKAYAKTTTPSKIINKVKQYRKGKGKR